MTRSPIELSWTAKKHSAAQSLNHAMLTAAVMSQLATIRIHTFYLSANYYSPIGHIVAITVHEVGLLWDTDLCLLDSLSGKAGDPVLIEIS